MTTRTSAVTAAVSAAVLLGLTACSSDNSSTHLTFDTRNTTRAQMDLGTGGPSVVDELDGDGEILAPDGSVIGHFELASFATREEAGREQRMTLGEYNFGGGEDAIMIMGANDYPAGGGLPDKPIRFAVTGGTGKYAGAAGQCGVSFAKPKFAFDCTLTGVKG